ncbi:MAG: alkaline phosphatase family protein [Candidatus Hodarchaeota archaeon]
MKVSIFILIDALGWQIIKDRPFLNDILPYRAPLKTILGFSSAALPSILTGKYPDEHGHWSMFFLSPNTSPFKWTKYLRFLPPRLSQSYRFRAQLRKIIKKTAHIEGYFSLYAIPFNYLRYFDLCEKKNIYSPRGLNGYRSIFDHMKENRINYKCWNWRTPEKQNFNELLRNVRSSQTQAYFLYTASLDGLIHKTGTLSKHVGQQLSWFSAYIEKIYKEAEERFDQIGLFVFSDHGMTDLIKGYNLDQEIERLKFRFEKDYFAFYDSTMARFWFFSSKAREGILSYLSQLQCGSLLSDEELKSQHIFFEDKRYGEAIFLMKPGYQIEPSYMGRKALKAMHGYHPDDKNSFAVVMANKPINKEPRNILDLYEIITQELE